MPTTAEIRTSDTSLPSWALRMARSLRRWFASPIESDLEPAMSVIPVSSIAVRTRAGDVYRL